VTAKTPTPVDAADRVATAVRAVADVVDLHTGMFGEVGTYLPGRRVPGVRISHNTVEVHITVMFDASVRHTAAAVRTAVAEQLPGATVNVTVEDVAPRDRPDRRVR
jgi:uncharacterized alkaline shock family protein YloU